MNEKLKELYYQEDVIIGSKQNFINLAKQKLKASTIKSTLLCVAEPVLTWRHLYNLLVSLTRKSNP